MKLALRRSGHQQWESSQQDASSNLQHTLLAWVEQAARFLVTRLVADAEPRVWYTCDAEGRIWWHAHDTVTGRSFYDASEAEMRAWLEQRHASALVG